MTKRVRHLLYIAGLIIAVAVLGYFLIVTPLNDISLKKQELADSTASLEFKKIQSSGTNSSETAYKNQVDIQNGLKDLFWKKTEQLSLLTFIEKSANDTGVQQQLTISDIPAGAQLNNVPITLNISGPWQNIFNFLDLIERHQPLIIINDLSMTSTTEPSINAILIANTLWL